jgi:hypothetical protein
VKCLGLIIAAGALLGCSSSASQLTIKVDVPRAVNDGLPMQMLVRNVDGATFSAESYPAAATKVVTPDATVIKSEVVYPGASFSLSLAKPEKGELAVYFFFLTPGPEWKVLLPRPFDRPVQIRLGRDRVEAR